MLTGFNFVACSAGPETVESRECDFGFPVTDGIERLQSFGGLLGKDRAHCVELYADGLQLPRLGRPGESGCERSGLQEFTSRCHYFYYAACRACDHSSFR